MNGPKPPQTDMQRHDPEGRRLYVTETERRAFLQVAAFAPREIRCFCGVCCRPPGKADQISSLIAAATKDRALDGEVGLAVFCGVRLNASGHHKLMPYADNRDACRLKLA